MKIITLMCAACMTAVSFGGGFAWKVRAEDVYDGGGESASRFDGLAYVINENLISKEMMYEFICAGNDVTSSAGYVWTVDVSNGGIGTDYVFGLSPNEDIDFYFVLLKTDDSDKIDSLYLSSTRTARATTADYGRIFFNSQSEWSKFAPSSSFSGTPGWVSTSSVPEPTSAMLMLVGICVCMLRRKEFNQQQMKGN